MSNDKLGRILIAESPRVSKHMIDIF